VTEPSASQSQRDTKASPDTYEEGYGYGDGSYAYGGDYGYGEDYGYGGSYGYGYGDGYGYGGSYGYGYGNGYGYGGGYGYGNGYGYGWSDASYGPRHHRVDASDRPVDLTFSWHDAPGRAPADDLTVYAHGVPLLQVFSRGPRAYVRAGLEVAPIDSGTRMHLVVQRSEDEVFASIVRDDGAVVVRGSVLSEHDFTVDVVLPGAYWRSAVNLEGFR
jgi:hypothetical protein